MYAHILILLQAFAVCISCITGAAFGANIIKAETTTQIVAKLYQAHSENTQVCTMIYKRRLLT